VADIRHSSRRVFLAQTRGLLEGAPAFVKRGTVRAQRLEAPMTWRAGTGEKLHGEVGDWLIESGDRRWTVAAEIFEKRYRECSPGEFESRQAVVACEVTKTMEVETLEGWVTASPGDRLVMGPDRDVWPMSAAQFCDTYRRAAESGGARWS